MGGRVNYTMVGAFIVVLIAALIGGIFLLSNFRSDVPYDTYLVNMNEAVSELSIQAPVKYNGVNVGYVSNIELNQNNLQEVILTLKIKQGTPITESTIATMMAQGVTGITYVGLKSTKSQSPLLVSRPGEPYPIIKSVPSLLMQLDTALREVTDNIKGMTQIFYKTFDEQNQQALKQTLQNVQNFTKTLSDNTQEIDTILNNTSKASKKLPATINQLNATLTSTKKLTQKLTTTGQKINNMVDDSRAAMQNISGQTVPQFNETLRKVNQLLASLQALSKELKRNPSMLIRGKALPPPGPGEYYHVK